LWKWLSRHDGCTHASLVAQQGANGIIYPSLSLPPFACRSAGLSLSNIMRASSADPLLFRTATRLPSESIHPSFSGSLLSTPYPSRSTLSLT
jgi:hypothetical protein